MTELRGVILVWEMRISTKVASRGTRMSQTAEPEPIQSRMHANAAVGVTAERLTSDELKRNAVVVVARIELDPAIGKRPFTAVNPKLAAAILAEAATISERNTPGDSRRMNPARGGSNASSIDVRADALSTAVKAAQRFGAAETIPSIAARILTHPVYPPDCEARRGAVYVSASFTMRPSDEMVSGDGTDVAISSREPEGTLTGGPQ
jgi:hypothetical protein